MDFQLTEEQQMIQAAAREFAREEIAPVARQFDASGEFPMETVRRMGELGLMGIEVPEEYGGSGLDTIGYALAMMEICAADAAHGTIMSVNNSLFCHGILKHGTEEQKQRFVKAVASGEEIGAYALTEPDSGCDAGSMQSRAGGALRGAVCHDRPRGGRARHHRLCRRCRAGRLSPRQGGTQNGHSRLGHLRDRADRLPVPG